MFRLRLRYRVYIFTHDHTNTYIIDFEPHRRTAMAENNKKLWIYNEGISEKEVAPIKRMDDIPAFVLAPNELIYFFLSDSIIKTADENDCLSIQQVALWADAIFYYVKDNVKDDGSVPLDIKALIRKYAWSVAYDMCTSRVADIFFDSLYRKDYDKFCDRDYLKSAFSSYVSETADGKLLLMRLTSFPWVEFDEVWARVKDEFGFADTFDHPLSPPKPKEEDVRKVFLAVKEMTRIAYAIGRGQGD